MPAKLRHIAIAVPDLETAARFYEDTFGLTRVKKVETEKYGHAIGLSDGVVNLTLLYFPTDESAGDERGKGFFGIHHIGFMVDDIGATKDEVIQNGGRLKNMNEDMSSANYDQKGFELKCRDPNGVVFDVSRHWDGAQ